MHLAEDTRDSCGFQIAIEWELIPLQAFSAEPTAFARRVWDVPPGARLLIAGLLLTIALWGGRAGHTRAERCRLDSRERRPARSGTGSAFLLLPVLGIFAFVADLTLGLFFYRRDADRPVAFMLWIASAFTPTLLILATLIIL